MPVYEYQCKACQRGFEYQQRMSDPEKTVCEACGGELERLISRTAFSLKGGGWYKDLYSSAKPESAAKDGGADATSKSDAAPSTPAPAAPSGGDKPSGGGTGGTSGGGTGGTSGGGTTGGGTTGGGSGGAKTPSGGST